MRGLVAAIAHSGCVSEAGGVVLDHHVPGWVGTAGSRGKESGERVQHGMLCCWADAAKALDNTTRTRVTELTGYSRSVSEP